MGTVSGELWVNDVFLGNRKKDIDYAQRLSTSISMGNVITLNGSWRRTGADFRGLRQKRGSGTETQGMNFSVKTAVNHFIPLFGFKVPVSGNYSMNTQLPKFRPNSDTEITDEATQDSLKTQAITRGFSTSLSRQNSKNPLMKYTFDKTKASFSMSQSRRRSPASADTSVSMSGTMDYSLNFGPKPRIRLFKNQHFRYFLNNVTFRLNASRRRGTRWRNVAGTFVQDPGTYSADLAANGSASYIPFKSLTTNFRMQTKRDVRLKQELFGVNIGQETNRSQNLQATYRPPKLWLIGAFSPDMSMNAGYREDSSPNVRREGDPAGTRNVNGTRDTSLKLRFDAGKYLRKLFEKINLVDAEEASPGLGKPPAPQDDSAQPDSTRPPSRRPDPLTAVRKVGDILSSIRQIDGSFRHRLQTSYQRVPERPSLAYQLGLTEKTGIVSEGERFDSPDRISKNLTMNFDSGLQISRNIDVAARFTRNRTHSAFRENKTKTISQTWPDLNFSWKGVESFGPFARWFSSTNINMSYRKSKSETGRGKKIDSTDEKSQIAPSASFQWKNGMSSTLSFQLSTNKQDKRGSLQENRTMGINLDTKYAFTPGKALRIPLPFLRSKKLRSRLDSSLSMGYTRSSGKRATSSLAVFQPIPGTTTLRVSPRMTYNFSRALNGSFFIDYSRFFSEASNQTTTTVRVGISAIFTF
jgi:cell surface protein SprA